ncbi:MAG: oligosaccharide flippase family protein, partial [Halobacteriovoraceae bacterium]|nr:oligosaccharide flippase family protein [Halobacteriovoraceae bacterium]
ISSVDLISSFLLYVVQITSAIVGLKAWAFFLGLFTKKLIMAVLTLKYSWPLPMPKINTNKQISLLKNGFFFHINTLIVATNTVVLPLILTSFLDNHFIGLIFWMEGLVKLAFIISTNYNQVIFLTLSNLKEDIEAFKNMATLAVNNVLTLLALVYGIGAIVSPEIVDLVFGEKWGESKQYFPWVCLYMYFFSVRYLGHSIHYALGKPKLRILNELFQILLTYGLVYGLVKLYQFDGYFYGMVLANFIGLVFMIFHTRHWIRLGALYRFFTTLCAGAIPYFIVNNISQLKGNLFITPTSYLALFLLILLVLDRKAILDIKKSVLKIVKKS